MNKFLQNGIFSIAWFVGYPVVVIAFFLFAIDGIKSGQYGSFVQSPANLTVTKSWLLSYFMLGWVGPTVILWRGTSTQDEWRSRITKWFIAPAVGFFLVSILWHTLEDVSGVNIILAVILMFINIGLGAAVGVCYIMLRNIFRSKAA